MGFRVGNANGRWRGGDDGAMDDFGSVADMKILWGIPIMVGVLIALTPNSPGDFVAGVMIATGAFICLVCSQ